ncbi:hypothetical protein H9X85_04480 [Anaerotignum lactatifermentans]|jgi:hypothetical protein|uniref:Uncharacterized protein n=1 Tax=Anaerotignum lactatifermentans TaxID=160404 RepID=A0ABS2G8L7_9FIRM|nr:hypothetical protein [Anaerotignum lactatifermentans]MBM6828918.1 hypothetical protein [Anaerotignum lactatifermentans]MBM6876908.1 hypothetical protein [Anaerotignum lactatifermentans]MBM6950467.1 hypothetical protein [Anaerotignum lactatifermentans]
MKIFVFGLSMFITGALGLAILCGAAMLSNYTSGSLYFVDIWRLFGLSNVVMFFLIIGAVGLIFLMLDLVLMIWAKVKSSGF